MRKNKYILNCILVGLTLLFVAGISEVAMRFYYAGKHHDGEAVCLQSDAQRIYTLKAGSRQCNTNGKGYVDYDYPQEKSGKRIVVIGDSVASGLGVPFGKSFAKLLEKKLNKDSLTLYEVIVLAVPGYSTSQEIDILQHEAFLYDPDLILIAYHLNDPAHPLYHNAGGQVGIHFRKPTSYALFYLKRLLFRAKSNFRSLQLGCPKKPWCLFLHCVYRTEVEESFREITTITNRHATPVVFAFLPLLLEPDQAEGRDALYADLVELARKNGAGAINLMDPFQPYAGDINTVRLPNDPWHPNAAGHEIIAEALLDYLRGNISPLSSSDSRVQQEDDEASTTEILH
jgi:lysophospholipase L1-like esterase